MSRIVQWIISYDTDVGSPPHPLVSDTGHILLRQRVYGTRQSEPLNRKLMEPMNAPDKKKIPELLQEASGERDHAKVAVLVIEIV
jgi:hypothetical protein